MYPIIENQTESGALLCVVTDLHLRITAANQQVQLLAGAKPLEGTFLHTALPLFPKSVIEELKTSCLRQPTQSKKLEAGMMDHGQYRKFTWMVGVLASLEGTPESLQWIGVETTGKKEPAAPMRKRLPGSSQEADAVFTLDAAFQITAVNAAAETRHSLNADLVTGKPFFTFFCFGPLAGAKESALRQLQQEGHWQGVLHGLTDRGGMVPLMCHIQALKGSAGAPAGYLVKTRDLEYTNGYDHAEKENNSLKTLLQQIMDQTGALAWATDAHGRKRYMNATYRQAFKLEGGSSLVYNQELFDPEDYGRLQEHNKQVMNGAVLQLVEELKLPDNRQVKYRSLKFPVQTGAETLAAGLSFDITRELQREGEMAYLKQRFEIAAQILADIIADWDIEHDRLWRSDPETKIEVHEARSRSMQERYERLHPDDLERFRSGLHHAITSGADTWQCEYRYKSGKVAGRYKILKEKGVFLRNEAGRAVRMISVVQDLTEQRRLMHELEQKEKAVTAANIQGQEAERSKLARELHDNVGQVLAMCKLFVDVASDSVHHEYLDKCKDQLQKAISEIRELSHRLSPEPLNRKGLPLVIADMVAQINETKRLAIQFKRCNLFENTELPLHIQTTAFRIVQECISNILKHAHATEASLQICVQERTLRIAIKDNGRGFDARTAERGIGLQNIHDRIELAGGSLKLESAPGQGCSIFVQLPIAS